MTNRILMYIKRFSETFNTVIVYNDEKERENSFSFFQDGHQDIVNVKFHTLNCSKEKDFSLEQLKKELIKDSRYKMVFISCPGYKNKIIDVLGKVSSEKGVCAPFVEIDDRIMYFPKLRYSDLGMIRHICEMNFGENKYNILLASAN